ncbi:hypothetical protein A3715_05865 [Oleiphilus sp. HI0009]|nr:MULTISPECIES: OmpA family protein [unclassified Oleiphilus]KZX82812.1 hypothetical protein A3715_05865 [Oleiphilus sp. HI0009]KZY61463.1 hypothetical protein A3738_13950 [Oleiphilus sp. HI0066]KZY67749.1 hypothetical protein A3739_12090 [Oleiphilus sp. HI0067]
MKCLVVRTCMAFAAILFILGCSSTPTEESKEDLFGSGLASAETSDWRGYEYDRLNIKAGNLIDHDRDGVIHERDDCPDTLRGGVVDNKGCAQLLSDIQQSFLQINFDTDSAKVKPEYIENIGTVAYEYHDLVQATDDPPFILVEGHTDNVGSRAYNNALSLRRARAVATVLIEKFSVNKEHILISGQGFDYPIADNSTKRGRAKNRRMITYFAKHDRFQKTQWNIWTVELRSNQNDSEDKRRFQTVDIEEAL